jgi:hypothetical protein
MAINQRADASDMTILLTDQCRVCQMVLNRTMLMRFCALLTNDEQHQKRCHEDTTFTKKSKVKECRLRGFASWPSRRRGSALVVVNKAHEHESNYLQGGKR